MQRMKVQVPLLEMEEGTGGLFRSLLLELMNQQVSQEKGETQ
jgi:hypothetical protein